MGVSFTDGKTLRVPGPSPVPHEVAVSQARPIMWHRSPEFIELFDRVQSGLKKIFETNSDVLIISGSGTAGMESAVVNLLAPGEEAIVLSGGKFGERWIEIVEAIGAIPIVFHYPYGEAVNPEKLKAFLQEHRGPRVIFATQNESSTAVMNDIEAIAQVVKKENRILAVDAVSSLGGTPLSMDAWGVDVVVTGSQKCLMLPPGLAFVAVGPDAWDKANSTDTRNYYLNWSAYKKSAEKKQSPFTSAVSLMVAMDESLKLMAAEGAHARFSRHRLMQTMIREGLMALGFPLYVDERAASPTLTAARGGNVDVEALRKEIASKTDVILAGGQGELQGEIFRIGHMGAATPLDMVTTMGAIELGLAGIGERVDFGRGTGRALEVWQSWH